MGTVDVAPEAADDVAEAAADVAERASQSLAEGDPAAEPGSPSTAPEPLDPGTAPAPVPPRKPTKLMVDLAAAIRATTEAARDQALAVVEVDATDVIGAIRAASTEGTEALRRQSEEDQAGIKEWSKAEIARIREESEKRIAARKATLEAELAAYTSAVEHRIGEVDGAVARYRADMDAYFQGLALEDDPARLATMAEAMPEPLELGAWKNIADIDLTPFAAGAAAAEVVEPLAPDAGMAEAETAVAEPGAVEAETPAAEAGAAELEAAEAEAAEADAEAADAEPEPEPEPEAAEADAETADADAAEPEPVAAEPANPWGVPDDAWGVSGEGSAEGSGSIDRAAIMAALEAAAEAVVAAESAAEWADQAEAAAGVAETAAGLVAGRRAEDEAADARAVMEARVEAGGFDTQSFADRLARLLPSHGDGVTEGETTHDTGRRHRSRVGGQHRQLQAPSRPPRRGPVRRRRIRSLGRVRVPRDPPSRRVVPGRDPEPARVRRPRHRYRRRCRVRDRARSRGGGLTSMASTNRRPAIAILLPPVEAAPVVAELRTGGFEPIVVSDLAELAALVAVRRDVAVAVLDVEGEADGGASTWAVLHEFGRNIPALLVVNPSTLDRLDTAAPGHDNDEYMTRPYSAESIRWRIEAMCIRSVAVDDGSGPVLQGDLEAGRLDTARPARRRVQPQGRRGQDDGRHEPGRRAHGARPVRAPRGCGHGDRPRADLVRHGRRQDRRRRLAGRARGRAGA